EMTRARVVRAALLVAVAIAASLAVPLLGTTARDVRHHAATAETAVTGLANGPRPAFAPGQPQLLAHGVEYRWAPVTRPVAALRAPGGAAPVATLSTLTPEGTTNLVLVLGAAWRGNVEWVRVRLPILPNNSTGWVRRSALGGYGFVTTHLV